jgi:hypothetical protein
MLSNILILLVSICLFNYAFGAVTINTKATSDTVFKYEIQYLGSHKVLESKVAANYDEIQAATNTSTLIESLYSGAIDGQVTCSINRFVKYEMPVTLGLGTTGYFRWDFDCSYITSSEANFDTSKVDSDLDSAISAVVADGYLAAEIRYYYLAPANGVATTVNLNSGAPSFTVPTGVFELEIIVHAPTDGTNNDASFRLNVAPAKNLVFSSTGTTNVLKIDGSNVVEVSDSSIVYSDSSVLSVGTVNKVGSDVEITYYDFCPVSYTDVHSDFDPTITPDSSLYIVNDVPELQINFVIPSYYYNVSASYADCTVNPNITAAAYQCNTIYQTTINHETKCTFDLSDNSQGGYTYSGVLEVRANLDLDIDGYSLTRTVFSPISWKLDLDKTIAVTSELEVNVTEDAQCYTSADCNSAGCCADGVCVCDCSLGTSSCLCPESDYLLTGYAGTTCQNDTAAPICVSGCTTTNVNSHHGGTYDAYGRGELTLPVFSDNSVNFTNNTGYTISNIFVEYPADTSRSEIPVSTDITTLMYPIGSTTVSYNLTDASGNSAEVSYTVTVTDTSDKVTDCHQCQPTANLLTHVCVGNSDGATYTKTELSGGVTYALLVGDDSAKTRDDLSESYLPTVLPGSILSSSDTHLGRVSSSTKYVDCDCAVSDSQYDYSDSSHDWHDNLIINEISDLPTLYDFSVNSAPALNTDAHGISTENYYNIDYQKCRIYNLLYDPNPPTCSNYDGGNIANDVNDKNYSVVHSFDYSSFNVNYGLSGQANFDGYNGSYLSEWRNETGAKYYVGASLQKVYTSTLYLRDNANNTATCSWTVTALGSICVDSSDPSNTDWSQCDDVPPVVNASTCPSNASYTHTYYRDCDSDSGQGLWDIPEFTDDKYVKQIYVYYKIDGSSDPWTLLEQTDNSLKSFTKHSQEVLGLNTYQIKFEAIDMHYVENDPDWSDHIARCEFKVSMVDTTPPEVICPQSSNVTTEESYGSWGGKIEYQDACTYEDEVFMVDDTNKVSFGTSLYNDASSPTKYFEWANFTENVGKYDFNISIKDSSNNEVFCPYTVHILDVGKPTVTCPSNEVVRADQGQTTKSVSYGQAVASDTVTGEPNLIIKYSHPYTTPFPVGETVVYVNATDEAGNIGTCNFTVTVSAAYPYFTFDSALVKAHVYYDSSITTFKADLRIVSVMNALHRVNNIDAVSTIDGSVKESDASCLQSDPVCVQYWDFTVSFSNCNVNQESYLLDAFSYCTPGDCNENTTHSINVILSAANYCWQDLEDVTVTARLDMLLSSDLTGYTGSYSSSSDITTYDKVKTAFEQGDEISGIVSVSSPNVQLSNVDIVTMTRKFYNDSARTIEISGSTKDVLLSEDNQAEYATFTYTESDIPLETQYYTTYSGSIEVTYSLGSPSSATNNPLRRRLLQVGDTGSSTQVVSAETISFAKLEKEDKQIADPNDLKVIIKLTKCGGDNLEVGLENTIANHLRIDISRINVLVSTSSCLAQITIKQSECDLISITEVLSDLELAITDPFNNIHTSLYYNDDVPMDVTVDYNVFFVAQQPKQIESTNLSSSSNNSITSNDDWMMYSLAGVAIGAIISGLFISSKKK